MSEGPSSNQCQSDGCAEPATVTPKILVPARGFAATVNNCVSAGVGLQLCQACAAALKPAQWIGPELDGEKGNLREILTILTRGKTPLDFDRARIELVRLDSAEGRALRNAYRKDSLE